MDYGTISIILRKIASAFGRCILVSLGLPLLPVLLFALPIHPALALISGGFVIEYGAAPIGLGLGLPPLYVFYTLVCVEIGIFLGLYDIFRTLGESSPRVAAFLEKTHTMAHSSKTVERYGILGLIPCEILFGVYINAPVSWALGWQEYRSLAITMIGFVVALIVTILATQGFFQYMSGL